MATTRYRHPSDRTVGTNAATRRPVHPGAPELPVKAGRENKTPPPVNAPSTTADLARSTSWGRAGNRATDNPGRNGYGGASSVNPGEAAAKATINPQASTDTVLEGLVRGGVRSLDQSDDWQTRKLSPDRVPVHPDMKGASPSGTVPAKTGTPVFDPTQIQKP
jgi:hypothetical protein